MGRNRAKKKNNNNNNNTPTPTMTLRSSAGGSQQQPSSPSTPTAEGDPPAINDPPVIAHPTDAPIAPTGDDATPANTPSPPSTSVVPDSPYAVLDMDIGYESAASETKEEHPDDWDVDVASHNASDGLRGEDYVAYADMVNNRKIVQ